MHNKNYVPKKSQNFYYNLEQREYYIVISFCMTVSKERKKEKLLADALSCYMTPFYSLRPN